MIKRLLPRARRAQYQLASVVVVFLLFFRARYAFTVYSSGDDLSYFNWLQYFLGLPVNRPSWTSYAPGIAFLWLPAGIAARCVSALSGSNLTLSLQIAAGLSSFMLWSASLFLANRIFIKSGDPFGSWKWPVLWMLNVPVLFYATNRATMAHAGEIFVALAVVDCLLNNRVLWAILLSILLTFVRYNDLAVFALLLGQQLDHIAADVRSHGWWQAMRQHRIRLNFLLLIFSAAAVPVLYVGCVSGSNGTRLMDLLPSMTPRHAAHIIFGSDWGLLWVNTWWLCCFAGGLVLFHRLSWMSRGAWLWMLGEFLLCLGWDGNGSEFAYRYLIGSYAAALLLQAELLRHDRCQKLLRLALVISGLWVTYLTWIFKTTPAVTIWATGHGWANPLLQWEALKMLAHPTLLARPLALCPPVVVLYSWFFSHQPALSRYVIDGQRRFVLTGLVLVSAIILVGLMNTARKKD